MSPQIPRLDRYDPRMLEAFESSWVVIQSRDPFRDFERDTELKTVLRLKLMALAADGVTDPDELQEWALEGLLLN
ncbi:MAG: hypothetical protein ACRECX_08660 [Methyloceanibacter sp.]|uniref:hypothetical protein n=1 Tax=Methyloceanibacter sp. TaxID=1965321 RepID=UPI003D6D03A4